MCISINQSKISTTVGTCVLKTTVGVLSMTKFWPKWTKPTCKLAANPNRTTSAKQFARRRLQQKNVPRKSNGSESSTVMQRMRRSSQSKAKASTLRRSKVCSSKNSWSRFIRIHSMIKSSWKSMTDNLSRMSMGSLSGVRTLILRSIWIIGMRWPPQLRMISFQTMIICMWLV